MIIWEYISCVYKKKSLCIHKKSLVHAHHFCMLWARDPRGQGSKRAWPGPWAGPSALFGHWPRACTRVSCMHKRSLVYTQETFKFLCMHNICINVTPGAMLRYAIRLFIFSAKTTMCDIEKNKFMCVSRRTEKVRPLFPLLATIGNYSESIWLIYLN